MPAIPHYLGMSKQGRLQFLLRQRIDDQSSKGNGIEELAKMEKQETTDSYTFSSMVINIYALGV